MKKKTFKKIVPAALVGLIIVGGASAWISTKETQVGVNKIKSGTFGIKFVDTSEDTKRENTVITLNGSKAIPMTNKYANDNLEPYNFTLLNDGDVDLAYTLYLVKDENEFKFDFENPDGEYFVDALLEYDYNGLEKNPLITQISIMDRSTTPILTDYLKAGESKTYDKFIIYFNEYNELNSLIKPDGTGRKAKFHLEVEAVQKEAPTIITIEGKDYTVIEQVEGTKYKVFAPDAFKKAFDSSNTSNNYATSTIATYLDNDYYNTLDANVRNAIVETPINQRLARNVKGYPWTGETRDAGTHKIFLPSFDEVAKTFGPNDLFLTHLTPDYYERDLRQFFIRDAIEESKRVLVVQPSDEAKDSVYRDSNNPDNGRVYIRPVMVLDLSRVEFTKK